MCFLNRFLIIVACFPNCFGLQGVLGSELVDLLPGGVGVLS